MNWFEARTEDDYTKLIAEQFRDDQAMFTEAIGSSTDAGDIQALGLSITHAARHAASIERDLRGLPPMADDRDDSTYVAGTSRMDWS
jgi:hypothetical protein